MFCGVFVFYSTILITMHEVLAVCAISLSLWKQLSIYIYIFFFCMFLCKDVNMLVWFAATLCEYLVFPVGVSVSPLTSHSSSDQRVGLLSGCKTEGWSRQLFAVS